MLGWRDCPTQANLDPRILPFNLGTCRHLLMRCLSFLTACRVRWPLYGLGLRAGRTYYSLPDEPA